MGITFLKFGNFSVIILINILQTSFFLDGFSFFNTCDSQIWSFDGVSVFLPIPFTGLELFD
jgi:hypothetical protein